MITYWAPIQIDTATWYAKRMSMASVICYSIPTDDLLVIISNLFFYYLTISLAWSLWEGV